MTAEGAKLARLTERQAQILRLVSQGYTSKEIARQLSLSPSTIDNHLLAAVQMLDAPNRAEAARWLISHEARQNLPSEPPTLPNLKFSRSLSPATSAGWANTARQIFALPPIGGRPNDLSWEQRTLHILRVAVVSLALFSALALVIAGLMTTFK